MISKICIASVAASALVGAVKVKSKCPFGYTSSRKTDEEELVQVKDTAMYPSDVLVCPADKTKVLITKEMTKATYEEIALQIIDSQIASNDKTKYAACLLRLAGHDLMDYRQKWKSGASTKVSGGSDGCINFEDSDNVGLPSCLAWTGLSSIYE